eukprot:269760-Karenia_brevis.AAC.1
MPPKHRTRRAKATAKALALAKKNKKREERSLAVKAFNTLAKELHMDERCLSLRTSDADAVEKLVRLLERRATTPAQITSLREAAKRWTDNGGTFSAP